MDSSCTYNQSWRSLWGPSPWQLQKFASHSIPSYDLTLTFSRFGLPRCAGPWWRRCCPTSGWTLHLLSLGLVLPLSNDRHALQKWTAVATTESSQGLWRKHTYLEGTLETRSFCKITMVNPRACLWSPCHGLLASIMVADREFPPVKQAQAHQRAISSS